jgi:integrase
MGRRGRNEGSIYKRLDGRWVASLTKEDGKRDYCYGKTRQEVQRWLSAARRDKDLGLPVATDRQTVAQYLASWLEIIRPTIDASTWKRQREYVELHIVPKIGRIHLRDLSPQAVQQLYSDRLSTGLSPSTVHHLHGTLHKALKDAERLGLVARNVCKLVNAPRMAESEIHPLSREDARVFLDVASGERLEALYAVALATGMRQSELLGLRWEDVDFDQNVLHVRMQLKREGGEWVWRQPKTRRSRRQIALAAPLVETLRLHRERQAVDRLHVGSAWRDCDLVFCTRAGGPLIARNLVRSFMALLDKAAVPQIRFHDLRHTCATLLLSARVNPKVVSEMLGHASVSITLDIYSHVILDMQQDAAAVMAALLYS